MLGRLLLVLSVMAALPAAGQETSLRASVDATRVGLEDQVELTITVEGRSVDLAEELRLPPLKNLRAVAGPSVSTQVSIVNGAMSQARVYTWLLQPQAVGPAEVGVARARLAAGEKTTTPLALEVVPGRVRPDARARHQDPFDPFRGEDPFESFFGRRRGRPAAPPKLRVEASVDRTRLHVGEPVVLTYHVVTQTTVTDLAFVEAPQYAGFWAEDLPRPTVPPGGQPVTVEGEAYRRFAFLQKLLFPTRAGPLTLPAVRMRLSVAGGAGFFADPRESVVERATRPIALEVEPLPGEPGFQGAVGRFKVTALLDREAVSLGEAANLRFSLEGTGNLKWVDQGPEVKVPGAKVYPPQVKSDLKPGPRGIQGSKTWEFVVVPETAGSLEVPALPFAYFDPQAGRVVRVQTRPLPLRVEGAVAAAGVPPPPFSAPRAAAGAPLPLRADLDSPTRREGTLGARVLLLVAGAVLLGHVGLLGASHWRDRRRRAEGRSASRRGVRHALGQLAQATRPGLTKEAAAALVEAALRDVFGPLPEEAGTELSERQRAVREVLGEVHFVRYAPQLGDYTEKLREVSARAAAVVRKWA
jgi:hypothetical protein